MRWRVLTIHAPLHELLRDGAHGHDEYHGAPLFGLRENPLRPVYDGLPAIVHASHGDRMTESVQHGLKRCAMGKELLR